MEEDKYGSVLRESLKRSMERPANYRRANEPYRSTNKREPSMVKASILIVFMVSVLALGVAGFFALDQWESHYRTEKVLR